MKKWFLGLVMLLLLPSCSSTQDVKVTINEAPSAIVGEVFEILVTIENLGTTSRQLTSVDIGDDYLEGAALISSDPSFIKEWDFGLLGFQSYDYQMDIEPGASLTLVYVFEAQEQGNFEGGLDVCIDTEMDCIYNTIFTTIQ